MFTPTDLNAAETALAYCRAVTLGDVEAAAAIVLLTGPEDTITAWTAFTRFVELALEAGNVDPGSFFDAMGNALASHEVREGGADDAAAE